MKGVDMKLYLVLEFVLVLGVGFYGIVFVFCFVRNGNFILFWGCDEKYIVEMKVNCENVCYFLGVIFLDVLVVNVNLEEVVVVS